MELFGFRWESKISRMRWIEKDENGIGMGMMVPVDLHMLNRLKI